MKRLALLSLAVVSACFAQIPITPVKPVIKLVPYGTWVLCVEHPELATSVFCTPAPVYPKGQEPDLLLVTPTNINTVAFAYAVVGTDINGVVQKYTGVFMRNDAPPMITGSHVTINAGLLVNVTITIQELTNTTETQVTAASVHP